MTTAEASATVAHSILVVDDDPHIRDVVRFAFEKTGMTISTAQDGKEALRQFDQNIHELVVLDIGMPEMDGYEVARRIRGELGMADPLLVALSGYGEDRHRRLAREAGFDQHITKPVDASKLEELLKLPL